MSEARPASPQTPAEVRSQAIAKLKRAASLPRRTDQRRPSHSNTPQPEYASIAPSPAAPASYATPERQAYNEHGEEVLSPSPTPQGFDGHPFYPYPNGGVGLQRSASASSSFHIPTPPHLPGYSQISTPQLGPQGIVPKPDWAHTPSYGPSLSPMPHPVSGRNTPSPLPTLGELRTLQRSNSAAARAKAMDKLTGGRETPAFEDQALDITPTRPGLQRADSLGAPRVFEPLTRATPPRDHPPSAFVPPKPRLQRSFTVGGSNMGEERRSAVGRRMVARLGERKTARDTEEDEVRQLWEEKRAQAEQVEEEAVQNGDDEDEQDEYPDDPTTEEEYEDDEPSQSSPPLEEEDDDHVASQGVPDLIRHSPTEPPHPNPESRPRNATLGVPEDDRPGSRTTQISEGDAFEYESHLRRSLSSRTARGAVGTVSEAVPAPPSRQDNHVEQLHYQNGDNGEHEEEDGQGETETEATPIPLSGSRLHELQMDDLGLPNPPFATPSRHAARESGSSGSTHSPGGDSSLSADGLQSMMFVMGSGSGMENGGNRETSGFPVDVEEGGNSNWGTPAKSLHPDRPEHQHPSTVSIDSPTPDSSLPPASGYSDNLTPLELSARSSVMSWEELGGDADRVIPSENYSASSKKPGSISSKVGRVVKGAMRKRSQSRSSTGSAGSPPTSPKSLGEALSVAVQSFGSRRGSASSVSPSQASVARSFARGSPMLQQGDFVRHQPSVSSLAPSLLDESSANGLLLQHQLANDPQSIHEMPRAKIDDPRVFNSKLSPFPGVEARRNNESLMVPEHPRLIHQHSDSVVPSQQRVTPQVPDTIHSLPLPPPAPTNRDRRGSEDSTGRKNWLAKAFGSNTSPRSSGGVSRKSSMTDQSHHSTLRSSPDKHASFADQLDADPFAGPPPPVIGRSRAVSPSVSTVAEGNEEGSRLTQFTVHRSATHTPVHPDIDEEEEARDKEEPEEKRRRSLPPRSKEVLARMDGILALGPDDPNRPDILDDPPRKLLLATQVLQVVNMHTVKDRYLLLFNDILAICKPVIENGPSANLDMRFVVKSIISLDKLQATGFTDDLSSPKDREALTRDFVARFADDPYSACSYLIEQNTWKDDLVGLAMAIHRTPELDKSRLGIVLATEPGLLAAYIDTLNLSTIPIDIAFRVFLFSFRLPADPNAVERILAGFATRYFEINRRHVSYDLERTHSLVTGMMMLNDSQHDGTFGFAMHNPGLTVTVWIGAFGERDPHQLVSQDTLRSIYSSIQRDPLQPPLALEKEYRVRPVRITPEKLPSRLTYHVWSEPITITLPAPDADFGIRLLGEGIEVEPAYLDFSRVKEATFRIRGTGVGTKTLLLSRLGRNATLYPSLGIAKIFHFERAFMKHTFHLSFANHLGVPRRYCFSVPDAELRTKWGVLLPRQISITRQKKSIPASTTQQRIRSAAEAVALLVLRDALIPPPAPMMGKKDKAAMPRVDRQGSVSVLFGGAKDGRADVNVEKEGLANGAGELKIPGFMEETTGKEVVLVCRQNSLLPGMLELLQAGVEPKDRGARF